MFIAQFFIFFSNYFFYIFLPISTYFYIHFSRTFQKYRSVALVREKLWSILDFFLHRPDFLPLCILKQRNVFKNPLHFFSLKVKRFHGDSVKNPSARGKKLTCLWLNNPYLFFPILILNLTYLNLIQNRPNYFLILNCPRLILVLYDRCPDPIVILNLP